MIVNDNLYVNQGVNSIRKQNISNYKTKDKTVEGNSLNALESQGRAQVNMSFKGKINYEMSDEELQKKKKLFWEKFNSIQDEEIKSDIKYWNRVMLNKYNIDFALKFISDENLYKNLRTPISLMNSIGYDKEKAQTKLDFLDRIISLKLYKNQYVFYSACSMVGEIKNDEQKEILNQILSDEKLYKNENVMQLRKPFEYIKTKEQFDICKTIMSDEKLYNNEQFMEKNLYSIVRQSSTKAASKFANKILSDENLYNDEKFMKKADYFITCNSERIEALLSILDDNELAVSQQKNIIRSLGDYFEPDLIDVSIKEIKDLNKIIGKENAEKLSLKETAVAVKVPYLFNKQNINEIAQKDKRDCLKGLVASNTDMFDTSENMQKMFPLLPKNQEDYCSLLPALVRSLGIETNTLNNDEIKQFNAGMEKLSSNLENLSNEEFKNLKITQEYTKNEFISDVLDKVKDLPKTERQKVYDYFGFELHHNKNADFKLQNGTGYSLTGYAANLNNGKKLADIKNPETKKVVEDLRENVIHYSENNKIICSNKELEENLNEIIKFMPELRTEIGCIQAGMNGTKGSHQYDIFKHSLKVMQEIIKNPEYKKLNDSDKKIMLMASLLHDITKKEGYTDRVHAENSSFDAFFIAKKFKLNQEEEIKLYNLIKNHEWLSYVNRSKSKDQLENRLKSAAYDFRHDNMFDMSLMFTHADLKGVNDEFHDIKNEKRIDFEGNVRSYGEAADFYAKKINKYIAELKKSQPLLPVTKLPNASKIEKAVTKVNEDGSTNIKGVYKDKDGLIVLKFNELENEDLEKIGFAKNSSVKGLKTKTSGGDYVNTGNVKFFAHGLDYPNQLAKFSAFSLIDSDALLSVSYAERPESKYRFFRTQGILLDCDTKYIHGGGETDSGSGCGKNIDNFKTDYILGGERTSDRTFIANLIKKTLNLDTEEYLQFIKDNENKAMHEIVPEEARNKLIKAFSSINSSVRTGNREYNEMYISNPKPPMGVFAYSENYNEKIKNPLDFLNRTETKNYESVSVKERTDFLRQFAIENDLPFIVFGN